MVNSNQFPQTPSSPLPIISSFTITDYCKRKINIAGANFNSDISKDSIFFGDVKGLIDSASSTQLMAEFPSGYVSGNIRVDCNGRSAISTENFVNGPPTITSFTPFIAGPGALVTIIGQNFSNRVTDDSVFFNNVKGTIVSASSDEIVVRVPQLVSSGTITLFSHCQSVHSTTSFVFSNRGIVYASSNSGFCYAIDISSGTVNWKTNTNSKYFAGPTYRNGRIYIGSSDVNDLSNNYMFALDAQTGEEIWRYQAGPWDGIPAINQDVLYAGGFDKKLYAFNSITGEKIWDFTADDYFRSASPTWYNGNVYSRNDDGYFYSINAATGILNWRSMIWPGGNPTASNGIIYTAGSGTFYALRESTGTKVWSRDMQYLSGSSPTLADNMVFIAAEDHQVYALDAATGNLIWQKEASWWVGSAVVVADNILYVHASDGVLSALDKSTGNLIWMHGFSGTDLPGTCPVVANNIVFVGDQSGYLNAIDAKSGVSIWSVSMGGYPVLSSPCVVDSLGNVYHAGDSGNQQ